MQKAPAKKKKQIKPVTKPYLTGAPIDKSCVKSCLGFFLATLGILVAFLIMGSMMMWDNMILRTVTNVTLLLCAYSVLYYSGANKGTTAVNAGEIFYQRREKGLSVADSDLKASFHPLKGFMIGLIGSIPIFVCALVLALTAKRQMTGYGALPSWTASLLGRSEVGDPIIYYTATTGLLLTDILRLIVRISLMPLVNIIGTEAPDAMLLMERLSPLLVLLPGISYGIGYTQGVRVRTRVHTSIEENKRKSRKKQQNAKRKQKVRQRKGPEQLN